MNKFKIAIGLFLSVVFLALLVFATPLSLMFDKWWGNKVDYAVQKVDDRTNYDTIKKVEDTCRAMISSYTADKLTYEQYKDSTEKEKQGWGEQAKMRANKTAATYNNYILENSFVWDNNVPKDINEELEHIK